MILLKKMYETICRKPAPYYFNYSLWKIIGIPIRKSVTNVLAANCPFNTVRIFLYRLCGFKIGKHVFIGMRCYLDDMCYNLLSFGNNVIVSYGVYFACHGKDQENMPIKIEDGAYIGMRAAIISKNRDGNNGVHIGQNAVVGACAFVNCDVPNGTTAVGIPCRIIQKSIARHAEHEESNES